MRKSFVRLNYEHIGAPLAMLMRALGRSSEKQALDYVGMMPKDIERLYENSIETTVKSDLTKIGAIVDHLLYALAIICCPEVADIIGRSIKPSNAS